jgi:hypothetical protein
MVIPMATYAYFLFASQVWRGSKKRTSDGMYMQNLSMNQHTIKDGNAKYFCRYRRLRWIIKISVRACRHTLQSRSSYEIDHAI